MSQCSVPVTVKDVLGLKCDKCGATTPAHIWDNGAVGVPEGWYIVGRAEVCLFHAHLCAECAGRLIPECVAHINHR